MNLGLDDLFEELPVPLEVFLYDSKFFKLPPLSPKQLEFVEYGTQVYFHNTMDLLGWSHLDGNGEDSGLYVNHLVAKWGKGSGKDTMSRIILSRIAYLAGCLKNPQKYYNMMPDDSINMLNVAYSSKQAQEIFFEPLKRMLDHSPYFKNRVDPTEDHIKFPKDINLYSGHSEQESQEGHNLLAAVADEIAAFKTKSELEKRQRRSVRELEHSADALIDMMRSSAISRFPEVYKIIMISFTRYQGDYIMQAYDEGKDNPHWFVSSGATWEINPTKKREHFDEEYKRNPEKAKAKFECKPPKAIDAYFKLLSEAMVNETFPERPLEAQPLDEFNKIRSHVRAIPGVSYFGHIDMALSRCNAGVCLCHRSGFVEREIISHDEIGLESREIVRLPKVEVDIWSSFEAPPGGEIQLSDVRQLFFDLMEKRGFRIVKVTTDGFESADTRQAFTKKGVESERLSVDRDTEVYDTFKDVLYDGRLKGYKPKFGVEELQNLTIVNGNKIDHQQGGSKDEADALAGAVFNAVESEIVDACESDIVVGGPLEELFGSYDGMMPDPNWERFREHPQH
jgi:hypothetical protein